MSNQPQEVPGKAKLRPLTRKQKLFVAEYLKSENGRQAALKVYSMGNLGGVKNENTAAAIASQNLNKRNVAEAIEEGRMSLKDALARQGITPDKIARKVDRLLEDSDPNAVDKGLRHATSIYGVTDEPVSKGGSNVYNFLFSTDVRSDVDAIEDRIKQKMLDAIPTQDQ